MHHTLDSVLYFLDVYYKFAYTNDTFKMYSGNIYEIPQIFLLNYLRLECLYFPSIDISNTL